MRCLYQLKNFDAKQLENFSTKHPVEEGELVITCAQMDQSLTILLDYDAARLLSLWQIAPIQIRMPLWLVFARAKALAKSYKRPFGFEELFFLLRPQQRCVEEDGASYFTVDWKTEKKFKSFPKGYKDWDKYCFFIAARFGQLQAVDLESIEPALRADAEGDNLRQDTPETFENREAIIAAVPNYDDPYIKVPQVVNKE
ncbi:hypothetical protein IFM89_015754 [Coptis chinensis]|uniref:Uncharacterized protein n=1 Tax=Coptis chinensis TaxID=261450 RepID=A0A835LV70_9MAGN|nr:hypothetical protein IFM89_015754 [Coptis chinensis]